MDNITPLTAKTSDTYFNYSKIIKQFGAEEINAELISKIESVTGKFKPAHKWLKRGIFFAHRDMNQLLDNYIKGKQFYLYTGRGPSAAMHIGHMIQFEFTKYLQDTFDVPVVVQMSDDEKFYFKDITLDETYKYTFENAKDIISCGFNPKKTFIFSNLDYIGYMYRNIVKLDKLTTCNNIRHTFGLPMGNDVYETICECNKKTNIPNIETCNIGQVGWASKQEAPVFCDSFPHLFGKRNDIQCLVPCAIDQSPYFRLVRDHAEKLGYPKPALIHSQFLVSLAGPNEKMNASTDPKYTIFLDDTPDMIKDKIKRNAFSGGGESLKLHREFGANLDIDVSYQYLKVFLDDDQLLDKITHDYGKGLMMTKDVKDILIDVMIKYVTDKQNKKKEITQEVLDDFFAIKNLNN